MLDSVLKIIQDASTGLYEHVANMTEQHPVLTLNETPAQRIHRMPILCEQHIGGVSLGPVARYLAMPANRPSDARIIEGWDDLAFAYAKKRDMAPIAEAVFPGVSWAGERHAVAGRYLYVAGLVAGEFHYPERGMGLRIGGVDIGLNYLSLFTSTERLRRPAREENPRTSLSETYGRPVEACPLVQAMLMATSTIGSIRREPLEYLGYAITVIGAQAEQAFMNGGWSVLDFNDETYQTGEDTIWDKARTIIVRAVFDPTEELQKLLAGEVSERELTRGLGGDGDATAKYHTKRRAKHMDWVRSMMFRDRKPSRPGDDAPHATKRMLDIQEMLR